MPDESAQELSQAEIEALLAQASELSAEEGAKSASGVKSKSQAAALGDSSVFGGEATPAGLASIEPSKESQDRIMSPEEAVGVLGDIPMDISIELGRARLTIGELIDLRAGAVLDLDRLAGEPVDVLANGTVIARGEVVVVNDCYSVRVTEIVSED